MVCVVLVAVEGFIRFRGTCFDLLERVLFVSNKFVVFLIEGLNIGFGHVLELVSEAIAI